MESQWQVPNNLGELQRSDVTLQPLFQKLCEEDGKPVGVPQFGGDQCILKDNLLYVSNTESPRLVVPSELHKMI